MNFLNQNYSQPLMYNDFYCTNFSKSTIKNILKNCPQKHSQQIDWDNLKILHLKHFDFDGNIKCGKLIVNSCVAFEVLNIFKELFANKYPINSIIPIHAFHCNDNASMSANNTSAFNFRMIPNTNILSSHAMGLAIDINPLQNPYVKNNVVLPIEGVKFKDRSKEFAGRIDENDLALKLFKKAGWSWGGDWINLKDYQHFEKQC